MISKLVEITKLTPSHLEDNPVWQFCNQDEIGELKVKPVRKTPVSNTIGKIFGLKVTFLNGNNVWCLISNFDVKNPKLNQHFLSFSFFNNQEWFNLARYHDYDYEANGPKALSKFYKICIDEIFPIKYDLSQLIKADKSILIGERLKESNQKLSRSEIISLAVP